MNDDNQHDNPEFAEELQEPGNHYDENPTRHGCVTAWLIFMLIANSAVSIIYLVTADRLERLLHISFYIVAVLVIAGVANVGFAIMLLCWKKAGFYGFGISAVAAFAINIMVGLSPGRALLGLAGFGILYGILQIKNADGVSAWNSLH